MSVVQIQDVLERLKDPDAVVQYVGEKGYGKTTHLLRIRESFPECSYLHIPEGERRRIPDGQPVLIDEAQRLTWWQRRKLFRQRRAIVLGTHRDFTGELVQAGRKVTTLSACAETSVTRLRKIVSRRMEFARRSAGPIPTVSDATLKRLLQICGDDIRSMLQILYDQLQQMSEPGEINVR